MGYRAIEIRWRPRTIVAWATFIASRQEAARLWNDLVRRHQRIRRLNWGWPSRIRWQRWAKGRYPGLSAQSAQQIVGEFCEAVDSVVNCIRMVMPRRAIPGGCDTIMM